MTKIAPLSLTDDGSFIERHIGPGERETSEMLSALGYDSIDALIDATVPAGIRLGRPLAIGDGRGEAEVLAHMRTLAQKNQIFRSCIGMGYSDCFTPPVIQRNVLENPGWYTAYTPYQAEIAQGRLEALLNYQGPDVFGALLQYPATDGAIYDYGAFAESAHAQDALVVAACDLLALTLITPPAEWGADVAVGSTQRFGVPMGYGGPHAAFFATKDDFKRLIPGRIIGVSRDARGRPALRMALQTREQHIRREKATSNVCTAQVLLAVMASMYAVWHGPQGLSRIARRTHRLATMLAEGLRRIGFTVGDAPMFDTVRVETGKLTAKELCQRARERRINLRMLGETT